MTLSYKKKRLKHYLIFGLTWLALGSLALVFNPDNINIYGYILMGLLYLGSCLFEKKNY
ncbi:hypothetical protein SAMN04488552_2891 [Christiangramia echinicola]|uniref:Uncharacterized protein n=1 Tax=Christiangramia echinicola TaxID=279359 RepID=A0A1H1RJ65_9FLAO|nr:hypothetical protein SAMN04488552_2891 [Christiangramia echinicola]